MNKKVTPKAQVEADYPYPHGISGEELELWQEWHFNNDNGYQHGDNPDKEFRMLINPGSYFRTTIDCDVDRSQNFATTKRTLRRISFKLGGGDGDCLGSLCVQYGHDNGGSHLAYGCETEVFDVQSFDSREMYKLGYALLRLARTLGTDDQCIIEEQREARKKWEENKKNKSATP